MNITKENLLEIKKFEAWKRQKTINEIAVKASLPKIALASSGRALKRLMVGRNSDGTGIESAAGGALRVVPRVLKAFGGASKNIKDVQQGKHIPRVGRGQFMSQKDYGQMQKQSIYSKFEKGLRDTKLGIVGGIQNAQDALGAGLRAAAIKSPKIGGAIETTSKPVRVLAGAAIDTLKNRIMTFDPNKTSAESRRNPARTSFLSNVATRMKMRQ